MSKKEFEEVIIDIEANDFFDRSIDYKKGMPFQFKPEAKIWCIVLRDFNNFNNVKTLVLNECTRENLKEALKNTKTIIGHYIVGYDFPALQLFNILDYKIGYLGEPSYLYDKEVKVIDTLILSKLLQPDRFGGHGLEAWGERHGFPKYDFSDFSKFTPEMLTYCIQDTLNNAHTYNWLLKEQGNWDYKEPYDLELKLLDLTVKQSAYGFEFDSKLAEECLVDLDEKMETIRNNVNPILPLKPLNKGEQKYYTPPKIQFKQNGELSAAILKFIEKVGGKLEDQSLILDGISYDLPYTECVKQSLPADIDDLDHLKGFLLDLGWNPIEWKERDITRDSKKLKLEGDKLTATVLRYVESTLNGPYKYSRLALLELTENDLEKTLLRLVKHGKPVRVPVSPAIKVGTDKQLCPNLIKLGQKASFAADVAKYFTYRHRRNSIAGGKEDEEGEPITGFLANVREDGRISTPADTLGAASFRYLHKGVANIPRVSSLYGEFMRALFKAGKERRQFGFDFASLEAVVQGHYVYKYLLGPELAASLTAKKPNDIHCFSADTEILTKQGWKKYNELTLQTHVAQYDIQSKNITYTYPKEIIIDLYNDEMISVEGDRLSMLLTPEHRVLVYDKNTRSYKTMLAKDLTPSPNLVVPTHGLLNGLSQVYPLLAQQVLDSFKKNKDNLVYKTKSGYALRSFNKQEILEIIKAFSLNNTTLLLFTKTYPIKAKNPHSGKTYYQTLVPFLPNNTLGAHLHHTTITKVPYQGPVWCVSMPTTYVICKRNEKIFISGNSLNAKKLGIDRDSAKSFSYATMYGAAAPKLAKMLNVSLTEAEDLYEKYWDAVPPLKALKKDLEEAWNKTGRTYIVGIDGRKLIVRSQHSLINLLFQSAGAIITKYSIVNACKELEEKGLLGDPFKDAYDANKVFLMIVYHDECQFSIHPSLTKTHYFPVTQEQLDYYYDTKTSIYQSIKNTTAEVEIERLEKLLKNLKHPSEGLCEVFQESLTEPSDIGHKGDVYYVTEKNILSDILKKNIKLSCDHLNLRVPLGISWITGDSWKECH